MPQALYWRPSKDAKAGETDRVFCAVRPPGHHAEKRSAMGFCIFNNVAIGARYARRSGISRRYSLSISMRITETALSTHSKRTIACFISAPTSFRFFPAQADQSEKGRDIGEGYTFNITVAAGAGDPEFINIYRTSCRLS